MKEFLSQVDVAKQRDAYTLSPREGLHSCHIGYKVPGAPRGAQSFELTDIMILPKSDIHIIRPYDYKFATRKEGHEVLIVV
jgi:hypothetical protein